MDIDSLRDFVAVVQEGGISAGARVRGQPKQSVSRRLALLEAELGARLVERSTSATRMTDEGRQLFDRAVPILADLEDARRTIIDRAALPEGPLRISAPGLLGQTRLGQVIAQFCAAYPAVSLSIELNDRKVDLIDEGFDAAIRIGPSEDESLIARKFATSDTILIATSRYLENTPPIATPEDLRGHAAIMVGAGTTIWTLTDGIARQSISPQRRCTVSSLKLAFDIACEGLGIALVPEFLATPAIASGVIQRILPEWSTGRVDLRIVFPSRRLLAPRLRAFIDVLVSAFPEYELPGA
jgi:LysR family transcriptional regulator, regulator for bpeEF and oprC